MRARRGYLAAGLAALALGMSTGCASTLAQKISPGLDAVTHWDWSPERVKPWERDILARREMAFDPDPLTSTRRSHVYFSKEAALSAGEAGGGGCGCN
jgi:hypothetical protein